MAKPRLRRVADVLLVTLIVVAVLGLALGGEWLRAKFYGWVIAGEIEHTKGGGR